MQPSTSLYNSSILEDALVVDNLALFSAILSKCRIAVDTIIILKV